MTRPRSIRRKLISLYVGLLTVVFLCFGVYIYWGFQQFLIRALEQTLTRRAHQIASTILEELPGRGESYVAGEIQARYAPELNERVIRIIDAKGRVIYASKNAGQLFSPGAAGEDKPVYREEFPANAIVSATAPSIPWRSARLKTRSPPPCGACFSHWSSAFPF
jgi:hypothetical protein